MLQGYEELAMLGASCPYTQGYPIGRGLRQGMAVPFKGSLLPRVVHWSGLNCYSMSILL